MSKGVLLFAHNNQKIDYFKMATHTASRIHKFLDLPVSIVTDSASITSGVEVFDEVIHTTPDISNKRRKDIWINKGRYSAYDLTPYQDTLVLDVDYLVNSPQLIKVFNGSGDFCCHNEVKWFLEVHSTEYLSKETVQTHWATVLRFKKTNRVKQIFQMMEMVQKNYDHYCNIYKIPEQTYRNDYALTIALKTVNGHMTYAPDYFNWKLNHVAPNVKVYRDTDTAYTLTHLDNKIGKQTYIKIRDTDFHMLDKNNFLELFT